MRRSANRSAVSRHLLAIGCAAATVGLAAATAPAQGISRDEGVYLAAAESYAAFWAGGFRAPGGITAAADRFFVVNHEHPALVKELYGATHALLTTGLGWTSHLQGFRAGAFLLAGLLSWLLAMAGFELAGTAGALLAPALYWAVPRHFYHAHPAALDMPITVLWLATVLAYRRSLRGGFAWAVLTGGVFGAAIAVKHNAWFLPPLLACHWLVTRFIERGAAPMRERLRAIPLAFPAMLVVGPLVLLATWPWLWHDTLPRLGRYVEFHLHHENYAWTYFGTVLRKPPFPIEYPFVVTALTVPAAVLFVMVAGVIHAIARASFAVRQAHACSLSDEVLFLLNAIFPMALIAWPTVPHFGGVKHWMAAMPFLALLGARALPTACRLCCPSRGSALTAAVSAIVLLPAAIAVAHVHPYGTAAYNEIAGGAAGAATLGMQRQFWGDDVVGVLAALNEHAMPGARVWWQETAYPSVRAWQRDGRVRADLRWANGPEGADISLWQYHQEFRDREFRTWTEFDPRSSPGAPPRPVRPVTGLYLDEVPLVVVYARPGTWR